MRVKRFFSLAIAGSIFLLASGAFAAGQEGSGSPSAYLPEKHYVFGPVVDGAEITHDFIIQNKGTATLKINKVATD